MSKQNAVDLARIARSEAESITKGDKRTITAIINNWNECVKQAGFWCIYDFPTTGYTRKSQLVADLLRCADQLDEYVEPNPHAAQTVEQQTRELNAALTRVLDVEEAQAEALDINAWIDDLTQNGVDSKRLDVFCIQVREEDHAEALELNANYDEAVKVVLADTPPLTQDDFNAHVYGIRAELVRRAHAEALVMDSAKELAGVVVEAGWDVVKREFHFHAKSVQSEIVELAHGAALEMNVGIELALHIITKLAKPGEVVEAGDAAGGCLYRDGFNDINYLVSVALRMYREREELQAEALQWNAFIDYCWPLDVEDVLVGIKISAHEDNRRFDWLANRWSLFWAGCDYLTRRTMIEEAHTEALRIDAEQYAAPITCSIFQRNDGVQLALDSSCDVRFIRTSKNGEWYKAGFRNTDMEGYQPVESDVLFTSMPSRTLSYSDGVMVVSEA